MKRIIGIDPGASGALAFLDSHGHAVIHTVKHCSPLDALRDALCGCMDGQAVAYLERVGGFIAGAPLPGSSMFKMGHSAGYWEGALAALGVRTILVRPQEWQAGLAGCGGKKGAERKRALKAEAVRRFPAIRVTLDGCDALLIADYAMRIEMKVAA